MLLVLLLFVAARVVGGRAPQAREDRRLRRVAARDRGRARDATAPTLAPALAPAPRRPRGRRPVRAPEPLEETP
jgi:hypothetical protein